MMTNEQIPRSTDDGEDLSNEKKDYFPHEVFLRKKKHYI